MLKYILGGLFALFFTGSALADGLSAPFSLRQCIFTGTRDLTVASGSAPYTGCGFQPTSCTGFGNVTDSPFYTTIFSVSNPALTTQRLIASYGAAANFTTSNNFFLFADSAGTSSQSFVITSYDADGLTGTWTKAGTPSGTAQLRFVCSR